MKDIRKYFFLLLIVLAPLVFNEIHVNKRKQKGDYYNLKQKVEIVRVVDGDTIIIHLNNHDERLRLIGINAPESVKPNSPIECFGKEASQHMKDLLADKTSLEFVRDSTQEARDRFGRLLGYIFIDDQNIAEQMILDGYAYEYTYHKSNPYEYQSDFKHAEQKARKEKRGLWAEGVCDK